MRYLLGGLAGWPDGESSGLLSQVPLEVHQFLAETETQMPALQRKSESAKLRMNATETSGVTLVLIINLAYNVDINQISLIIILIVI